MDLVVQNLVTTMAMHYVIQRGNRARCYVQRMKEPRDLLYVRRRANTVRVRAITMDTRVRYTHRILSVSGIKAAIQSVGPRVICH